MSFLYLLGLCPKITPVSELSSAPVPLFIYRALSQSFGHAPVRLANSPPYSAPYWACSGTALAGVHSAASGRSGLPWKRHQPRLLLAPQFAFFFLIDLLLHLFVHSFIDSCMCPDPGSNPQPWRSGMRLEPSYRLVFTAFSGSLFPPPRPPIS